MLLIGLTGSIGMGKSETLKMFARAGLPVYDADATVHALYAKGGRAVAPVEAAFPGVTVEGAIDRAKLSNYVLGDAENLKKLERIVHPLAGEEQIEFLLKAETEGAEAVVLDIPLLLESGVTDRVDKIVVVSAPAELQRQRVLERPGMSVEKFESILAKQLPDAKKRELAHYIVETDKGLEHAEAQVQGLLKELKGTPGKVWENRKPK